MGLVLAIPITAALRVILIHTESWKRSGAWAQRLTPRREQRTS